MLKRIKGLVLASFSGTQAICHACERYSEWVLQFGYYRCLSCGQDPVAPRPDAESR